MYYEWVLSGPKSPAYSHTSCILFAKHSIQMTNVLFTSAKQLIAHWLIPKSTQLVLKNQSSRRTQEYWRPYLAVKPPSVPHHSNGTWIVPRHEVRHTQLLEHFKTSVTKLRAVHMKLVVIQFRCASKANRIECASDAHWLRSHGSTSKQIRSELWWACVS